MRRTRSRVAVFECEGRRPLPAGNQRKPARKWGLWSYSGKELNCANTGKEQETDSSLEAPERSLACPHLDFSLVRPLHTNLQNCKKIHSYGNLLCQQKKANTAPLLQVKPFFPLLKHGQASLRAAIKVESCAFLTGGGFVSLEHCLTGTGIHWKQLQ